MTDPMIGRKIGQYEVISLLGQGGMAVVYRVHQIALKRDVAMKVVTSLLTQDPRFMDRFNQEVEVIARLEHAHIVPVHEHATTDDGITYLTMRYFKGGTLTDRIHNGTPISLNEANTILRQIAEALDYAHQHGVIHRDIKPSNVLLDEQGNVYLADFGLAQMLEHDARKNLTEADTFLGTPTYVAPEQIQQQKTDERSDLYSLGVIVFEMLAGRAPFTGDSAFAIMRAHIEEPPPSVRKFRPELSEDIGRVLAKALSKDPTRRYQSGLAFSEAFTQAAFGEFTTQRRSPELSALRITQSIVLPTGVKNWLRQPLGIFSGVALIVLVVALAFSVLRPGASAQVASPVNEASRPDKGTPADLALSDSEIAAAKASLNGSLIGMVACALKTDYHASLARAVRTRAEALKLPIRIDDADADKTQQPIIINRFVAQGAKALIVCELDPDSVGPALLDAQKAGVKIVRMSDIVMGANSVTITYTNEAMGEAVGKYTGEMINKDMAGQAVVAILDYPKVPVTVIRANAMETALHAIAPKAIVVGRYEGGLPETAQTTMTQALKDHPDINVIMSINDAGSYGAVKALTAAGKQPGDVKIISVDAETEARRMINSGQFFVASVDSGAVQSGTYAVDAIVKLLAESAVPRQIILPGHVVTREDTSAATPAVTSDAAATAAP